MLTQLLEVRIKLLSIRPHNNTPDSREYVMVRPLKKHMKSFQSLKKEANRHFKIFVTELTKHKVEFMVMI